MERGKLRKQWMVYLIVEWVSKRIWCKSYSDQFRNSQRSLPSPTGGVKSIPRTTEKWIRKLYNYSLNNNTSTEDKHETNHINNKYNDMNMNTRNMRNTWACTERAIFVTLFDIGSHAPHGSRCSWVSLHHHSHPCASLFEFASLFFYFDLSFTIFSFFFLLLHFELHTEFDNLIAMQNLRTSADKESNDAYDVSVSLTEIDRNEFHELMAQKNPVQALKGVRISSALGSQFLFNAYKHVREGGTFTSLFAEGRTVFIPKFSDVDNNGRIVRPPEARRPLIVCNCDCKILTTAICWGLH